MFVKDDERSGPTIVRSLPEYKSGNGFLALRYVLGVFKQLSQTTQSSTNKPEWERGRGKAEDGMEFVLKEGSQRYEVLGKEGKQGEEEGRRIVEGCTEEKERDVLRNIVVTRVADDRLGIIKIENFFEEGRNNTDYEGMTEYVGRILEREFKEVVRFKGEGGWNGDVKTVRALLDAGVEYVLRVSSGSGSVSLSRDVILGVNKWGSFVVHPQTKTGKEIGGGWMTDREWGDLKSNLLGTTLKKWRSSIDGRLTSVYVKALERQGTPGARGVEVKGRMGMTYVQLVDGGIRDYEAFGKAVVEGVLEVVEEIKDILKEEGGEEGMSREEVVGGVYCGMLVFLEHGVVESLGEWGAERLRNSEGKEGDLGVSDMVLDAIEGIRTVVKIVDEGVWSPGSPSGVEGLLKGSDGGKVNMTNYTVAKERRNNFLKGVEEVGIERVEEMIDKVVGEARDIIKAEEGRNFNTSSVSGSTSHHFHIHTSSQLGPYNINDPMSISEDSSPGVARAVEYLKTFRSRVSLRRSLGGLWEVVMSRVREMFTSRILNGGRITVIGGIVLSRDVDKIIQLGESGGDTLREACVLFVTPPEAILQMVRSMLGKDAKVKGLTREVVGKFLRRRQDWRSKGGMGRSGWANEIVAEFRIKEEVEEEDDHATIPAGMGGEEKGGGEGERERETGGHASGGGMFGSGGFGSGTFKVDFGLKMSSKMSKMQARWGKKGG
ncbi:hypothetical protein TrCOL_g6095 [Triparma columacea]|uniref:Uncharacterized protein n=1 Tax=Triparma columacea TaxID=722753 RepID=A0A9W7GP01_9STRA|nr:hypothetical protein TrCOL_g6095 [Triparma columacea]